ncbi:MAG: hypothetical protein ABH859_02320 [Pseudomonadota bacterium]
MKKIYLFLILSLVLIIPQAQAGLLDDVTNWWQARSVASTKEDPQPVEPDNPEDTDESDEVEVLSTVVGESGKCLVPRQPSAIICKPDAGFLCLNTPEPGVKEDFIIIKGTLNRAEATPASISIAVQNEYTKETQNIDTSDWSAANCWESNLENKPFCLSEEGYFAARLPLAKFGPYTISVSASRFSGSSETVSGKTSKVKAFTMDADQVSFEPDLRNQELIDSSHVNVAVSLLKDCQNCDFIGASTHAVTVTVENNMRDTNGNVSSISCQSRVEQGGQGNFEIGVPVIAGNNELTITACNPAIAQGACPTLSRIKFQGSGATPGLDIISPAESLPIYTQEDYPEIIPFQFRVNGIPNEACVEVAFNRNQLQEICLNSTGLYETELAPQQGINIVTVDYKENNFSQAWVFGWGKVKSPFNSNNEIKDGLISASGLQLILASKTIKNILAPFLSNYLSSDEFQVFIGKLTDDLGKKSSTPEEANESPEEVAVSIPQCGGKSTFQDFTFTLLGEPGVGSASIEQVSFAKDALDLVLSFENLSFVIGLIKQDAEGKTVLGPIPLRISFREASINVKLQVNQEQGLILLSSNYTDCDFKKEKYCKGTPASLIPQNFVGNATNYGFFVKCDTAGFDVSEEVQDLCHSFNELDNQTGLISEAVLDAINSTLYCTGSKFLTQFAKNGFKHKLSFSGGDILGNYNIPLGVNLANESGIGLLLNSNGMLFDAGLIVGDQEVFADLPIELQIPSVGVISATKDRVFESVELHDKTLRLALTADAINHLLFIASAIGVEGSDEYTGLVDIKLSEPFFKQLGFDFVEECDVVHEDLETSSLCLIRPTVSDLLGASLTTYGYFPPNQPVLMRIQGSRVLAPHLALVTPEEIPPLISSEEESSSASLSDNLLDFQIGGLRVSFYALEVAEDQQPDQFGNLPILLDEEGKPVIHSLRPDVADPWQGQIASFELAILLAAEVDTSEEFQLKIRPLGNRTRLVISPIPGTNTTTVPSPAIISSLYEKAQIALNMFSDPEKAFKITIPKDIELFSPEAEQFDFFGLQKISFTENGLQLRFNSNLDAITIDLQAWLTQMLHFGGEKRTFELNKAN